MDAVVCYTALVAYGPRNADRASSADGVLIELVPDITTVTALVNTSVFPSLSVTVFALAWLTRDEFPRWLAVSGVLAASISSRRWHSASTERATRSLRVELPGSATRFFTDARLTPSILSRSGVLGYLLDPCGTLLSYVNVTRCAP